MTNEATGRCPVCDGILRVWIGIPESGEVTVGLASPIDPEKASTHEARLIDRCDICRAGVVRGTEPVDLARELELVSASRDDGLVELRAPNRGSLQAGIGGEGWAALGMEPGRLLHTPRSLELLAEHGGLDWQGAGFPPAGPNQRWMWQTLLNGLTIHRNFATEVRAGRLRMANARGKVAFVADAVASVLAAPFVVILGFPLEGIAALIGRGGQMIARAARG